MIHLSCILAVFENFRRMCLKIYHLHPAKFLSAPGLAWQEALKRTAVKIELLTDIDMLLMVEKRIRGRIYHAIPRYAKANNKYMKDYDKNKESSYLKYWDVNNLYGLAMSQKSPVTGFLHFWKIKGNWKTISNSRLFKEIQGKSEKFVS